MKTNDFPDVSSLRFYSYAVVTSPGYGGVIEVSPLESMNIQNNALMASNNRSFSNTHVDERGSLINSSATGKSTVTATWLHLHAGNRITPPDVVKNEQVMLYKYANVDKFYWVDLGHDKLRRLETVKWRFANLKDWNVKEPKSKDPQYVDESSSYMVTMSTAGKLVQVATSKSDSEKVKYTVTIDTKASVFSIVDDRGNEVVIESLKDTISVTAKNEVLVTAGKKIVLKAPAIVLQGTVYTTKDVHVKGKAITNGVDVNGDVEVSGAVTADEFFGPPPLPGNPHPSPVKDPPESEKDGLTAAERKAEAAASGNTGFNSLGEFFTSLSSSNSSATSDVSNALRNS